MRDFVTMAFKATDTVIDWRAVASTSSGVDARTGKTLVRINSKFYRPAEVDLLIGDPAHAREALGW